MFNICSIRLFTDVLFNVRLERELLREKSRPPPIPAPARWNCHFTMISLNRLISCETLLIPEASLSVARFFFVVEEQFSMFSGI